MNERIKELYGKALDKAVPYTWHNLDHVEVEKVMQELTELIVRECADIAADMQALDIYEEIREHFGVEL